MTVTTTLTDTLERQTMFGMEARRIKTVVTKTADANACDKSAVRSEIDAWYVDLPQAATRSCTAKAPSRSRKPRPQQGSAATASKRASSATSRWAFRSRRRR